MYLNSFKKLLQKCRWHWNVLQCQLCCIQNLQLKILGQILTSLTKENRERWEKFKGLKLSLPTQPDSSHRCRNPNRVALIICALELWTSLRTEAIKPRSALLQFIEQVQPLTKLFRRLVLHFEMGVNDVIIFLVQ